MNALLFTKEKEEQKKEVFELTSKLVGTMEIINAPILWFGCGMVVYL